MCRLYQNSLKRGLYAHCSRAQAMLPLAAYCKALRATCNTVRSLTLASNVCMVGPRAVLPVRLSPWCQPLCFF